MIFKQFEGFPSQHFSSCFSIFDITFIVEYKVKKGKKMVSHSRASSPVGLRAVHARRQVAATCRDGTSQQQIASCVLEYFCENLCSATEFLSQQNVAKNQIRQKLCDLSRQQNSVAETKIFFTKFLQYTVICLHDVSPQHVAATSRQTLTDGVICHHDLLPSGYRPLSLGALFSFTKMLELYSFWKECAYSELLCLH